MYDTEHSGVDIESIKAQCAACNGTGVVPLVRVPGFLTILSRERWTPVPTAS